MLSLSLQYALIEDENDEEGEAFCADDIDNILEKRTRTRVVEGTKTASWLNKQGMVVSKSKFSSEKSGADLDMDDPLFWQKIMPDLITVSTMTTRLDELNELVGVKKKKGPGRGHGRWKKKKEEEATKDDAETGDGKDNNETGEVQDDTKTGDGKQEQEEAQNSKQDNEESQNGDKDKPKETEIGSDKEEQKEAKENGDEEKNESQEEKKEVEETEKEINSDAEKVGSDDEGEDSEEEEKVKKLTRTDLRKINKYISDLKSMMQDIFDQIEDDSLAPGDKSACQKLLLTISLNEKLFNEQQRHIASKMLKRLEGDRRRRCRTSDQPRFAPPKEFRKNDENGENIIPDELRIVSKKRKKRRKKSELGDEPESKRRRKTSDEDEGRGYLGEDGYLHHSDSENDWSDIGEGLSGKKKNTISRKESKRRRQWGQEDDVATAAGRPWPVFPRSVVKKLLTTVLDEVIKYDMESTNGLFSVPVPREDFPEYVR